HKEILSQYPNLPIGCPAGRVATRSRYSSSSPGCHLKEKVDYPSPSCAPKSRQARSQSQSPVLWQPSSRNLHMLALTTQCLLLTRPLPRVARLHRILLFRNSVVFQPNR